MLITITSTSTIECQGGEEYIRLHTYWDGDECPRVYKYAYIYIQMHIYIYIRGGNAPISSS